MERCSIGIRREDKYAMERRTPVTPSHVKTLIDKDGLDIHVQSSDKRVFQDEEYLSAGAIVDESLTDCPVIMGVKEIPVEAFEPGKTYVFFSHVIKGQAYNMPMLKQMMTLGCNLIDYECIADDQNKRLIFFGRYAGLAGMINALWSLGQRLRETGFQNNPFLGIRQACSYRSLEEAKKDVMHAGQLITSYGIPEVLMPFTIGFTGYGNVSAGAQEIADLLPVQEITPEQLSELDRSSDRASKTVYKIVFKEQHLSKPIASENTFSLQDYYDHPENYESDFDQYLPHLSVLMNCMYWDARYPKIVTKQNVRKLFASGEPKLQVIGDITCDPEGSVEITHKGTEINDPVFVYNPDSGKPQMGFKGKGLLVMAVDILPSELPRESSEAFSDALLPYVKSIAHADFNLPFEALDLPPPIKRALILHKGALTPSYEYIKGYL
jgi:alanine dehydrogenase